MKGLYSCVFSVFFLLVSSFCVAQNLVGDFQSAASGLWSAPSTWEEWDGASWVPATQPPDYNDGSVSILSGNTVTISEDVIIDQVTVNAGGALNVGPNGGFAVTVTINDGAGSDLTLNGPLSLLDDAVSEGGNINVNGTLSVNTGGSISIQRPNISSLTFGANSTYQHNLDGGAVPIADWNSTSTCLITGVVNTPPTGLGQSFGNFTWDNPSQAGPRKDLGLSSSSIFMGSFVIANTNGALIFLNEASPAEIVVHKDFIVSGAARFGITVSNTVELIVNQDFLYTSSGNSVIVANGNAVIEVKRHLTISSGELTNSAGGSATFIINGLGTQDYIGGATISGEINYTVNTGSTLNLGTSALTGDGLFTLQAGATIHVKSPDGLNKLSTAAGNVQTASRSYAVGGNIIYNSPSQVQNLGDEWTAGLSGIAVNLEINNPNGVTNNNPVTTSLVGTLTLTNGSFNIGNSATLEVEGDFAGYDGITRFGTMAGYAATSSLIFSGDGTISGTLNFTGGFERLSNFTISRSTTVPLGSDLTIEGQLLFDGTGNLDISGITLTIQGTGGDIATGGFGGGFISDNTSNLILGGTGALSAVPFSGTGGNHLNNLTFNRSDGATYTWNGSVTIHGNVTLSSGVVTHNSGMNLASTATFIRTSGASISSSPTASGGSYNVTYNGADLTTGPELNPAALNNLTIENSGTVTLTQDILVAGDLSLNSGTLNADIYDLNMAGDEFLINGGASFTITSGDVIFSRSGSTVMGGDAIGDIQFSSLIINSGTTLTAPASNIKISGTWGNQGSFVPNGGTVTFNGTDQSLDANGQPFNNVVFANSGTKTLLGILDVNGSLTIDLTVTLNAGSAVNSINIAGSWENSGLFVASGNTVRFDGTSDQIIEEASSFYNLELAGSGTKTLASALDVDNNLLISAGVTLETGIDSHAITLGGNWTNDGTFTGNLGTVTFDNITTISGGSVTRFTNVSQVGNLIAPTLMEVSGNWTRSGGVFTHAGGTVVFNGTNAQTIYTGGLGVGIFNNITISGSGIKTATSAITCAGNVTLNSATATFVVTDRTIRVRGNFDASGGGALTSTNSLFQFNGSAQNIASAGQSFFNAEFTGGTKTLVDALDANGYVTIGSGTLIAGANTVNVGGNWNSTGGTYTSTGLTVFDGAVAQTILSGANAFADVTIAGSGTKTLQDALTVSGDLNVTSTLDVSTGNYPVSIGGNWDLSVGTFTARAGEVRFDGAAQNIIPGVSEFYSVQIAGTGVKTLQDHITVNGNLTFANATSGLSAGADFNIQIAGNWTNNSGVAGAFTAANGKVIFDGGATSNVTGTGITEFNSVDVTGSTIVEIESAHNLKGTLTLVGPLSQFNAVGSGGNGVFTLLSTADNPTSDARIATLEVPANLTGDVTVQRYISKESMPGLSDTRLYRFISSPVDNASVSEIQSEIPVTGTFTGASNCSGCRSSSPSMWAYDETIGTLFDDGWVEFPSASNTETLQRGAGYSIFVRGDIIPSALFDVRGPIFSGEVPLPLTFDQENVVGADGFNLVGNPYPSALDWTLVYPAGTNIANAVYTYDTPNGRYAQFVDGVGINDGSKDIAMGQGFWVQATGPNPTLTLTEAMKSSSSTYYFRTVPASNLLRVTLAQSGKSDEIIVRFKDTATDLFDAAYDGVKLNNEIFDLSSVLSDSTKLSINTLASMRCGREVKLDVADVTTGNYELFLTGTESFSGTVSIMLKDNYLGQTFDVKNTPVYRFAVDANIPESFGSERFKLVFDYHGTVEPPQIFANDVCEGSEAFIEIANSRSDVRYAIYMNGNLVADIGEGNGSALTHVIPQDKLVSGENIFELRAQNAYCDQIMVGEKFTIVKEVLPELNVKGSSSCLSGSMMLTASGAEEGDYRWYEGKEDVSPISGETGSIFTTPELDKTSTYYVAAVNDLGCEGPRAEVVAEIMSYEPVSLSETKNGQLVSNYAEGNRWYLNDQLIPGATGNTYTPTESGTYTVTVEVGHCVTSAQRMFLVTGTGEGLSNGNLKIYPNPVAEELVFETNEEQKEPPVVFDQTGKALGEIRMKPSGDIWSGSFDFTERTRGLYILRITEDGVPRFKRVVKE